MHASATKGPLKVLHVASNLDVRRGGSIWATLSIASSAHRGQTICEVVGTELPGSNSSAFLHERFPQLQLHPRPCHFPKHNFHSLPLWAWLRRNVRHFDVVHCHEIFHWPFVYAGWVCRSQAKPLIVSPHNSLDPEDLKKHAAVKAYVFGPLAGRPVLQTTQILHCTSALEARRLVTFGARPAPRPFVLPLPVLPVGRPADREWFRREIGISADQFVLLFLGRLDPKKNLDLLLKAVARIRQASPQVILAVCGDGEPDLKVQYKQLAAQLKISQAVKWCGFLTGEQKSGAICGADLFVLPSRYENFAIAAVEAMQAGTPVLISGGVFIWQELLEDDAVAVCDPCEEGLHAALLRLLNDPAELARLSERGRMAGQKFVPNTVGPEYSRLYATAVAEFRS